MRYLLDTNLISVVTQRTPDPRVSSWLQATPTLDLAINTLVLGEVEKGISALAPGRRRDELLAWARQALPKLFAGRILPVDEPVARRWGLLTAEGKQIGRPLPVIDGLMLATAERHGLVFVSRNVTDVAQRGVPVLDPFTGTLHP